MMTGYKLRLTNFARDVIYHDFLYSATPSKLKVGGTDENLLKEGDGGGLFHRSGDNIFTPEAYTFNATIIGDSVLDVRNKVNAISDALEQSEAIEIISAAMTTYVITLSNSDVEFRHHIGVKNVRHGANVVNLTITVNIASTFVTVIPPPPDLPVAALDLNAANKVFSDAAATIPAVDTDPMDVWQNDIADQYHARQSSASNKFLYDTATFPFPVAYTDGSPNFMQIDDYFWGDNGGTIVCVIRQSDKTKSDTDAGLFGWKTDGAFSTSRGMRVDQDNNSRLASIIGGLSTLRSRRRTSNWYIQSITNDPSNAVDGLKLYVNKVLQDSAAGGTPSANDLTRPCVIGGLPSVAAAVEYFKGFIQRLLFYEEPLTETQYLEVVQQLMVNNSQIRDAAPAGVPVSMWLDSEIDVFDSTGFDLAVPTASPGPEAVIWGDQSPNAYGALTIGSGTIKPRYEIVDDVNALGFDNDNYFLNYDGDYKSLFIVLKYSDLTPNWTSLLSTRAVGGGPNFLVRAFRNDTTRGFSVEGEGLPTLFFPSAPIDEWYMLSYRFDDTEAELRINNIIVHTGAVGTRILPTWNPDRPPALGAGYLGLTSESERLAPGWIRDVVVSNTTLNDTDFEAVGDALLVKNSSLISSPFTSILTAGMRLDFDPAQDVYTDAGSTVALVGEAVQQVTDESTQGNDATQLTGAAQGILQIVDGHRAITFDGVDDFFELANVDQVRTAYVIAKYTGLVDASASVISAASNNSSPDNAYALQVNNASGIARWVRQASPFPDTPKQAGISVVYCVTYNTSTRRSQIFINGRLKSGVIGGSTKALGTDAAIGCLTRFGGVQDQFFPGSVFRILTYDVEHSSTDILYMQQLFKSQYSFL